VPSGSSTPGALTTGPVSLTPVAVPRGGGNMSKQNLKQKAYRELKEFVIITLYLTVVFSCFIAYKSIVLGKYKIDVTYHGLAIINALALAKVMLIAKGIHFGKRVDEAPLIYSTLLKSALFAVVLACFKILEEFAIGYFHHKSFHESIADLAGGTGKGILTLTILLFVVLIPFVAYGELQRVVSEDLAQLFFHHRAEQTDQ
jgi:hypothetical protein